MATLQENSTSAVSLMEHQILGHIKQAMRVTLDWHAPVVSMPRKLSSLKFTIKSFQRHLERVISIEEEGGYMAEVMYQKPNLQDRIEHLAGEHMRFREQVRQLSNQLQGLSDRDELKFEEVCSGIRSLLLDIDLHDAEEVDLLQESLLMDDGGEG